MTEAIISGIVSGIASGIVAGFIAARYFSNKANAGRDAVAPAVSESPGAQQATTTSGDIRQATGDYHENRIDVPLPRASLTIREVKGRSTTEVWLVNTGIGEARDVHVDMSDASGFVGFFRIDTAAAQRTMVKDQQVKLGSYARTFGNVVHVTLTATWCDEDGTLRESVHTI